MQLMIVNVDNSKTKQTKKKTLWKGKKLFLNYYFLNAHDR
jgi:hypothetical protein